MTLSQKYACSLAFFFLSLYYVFGLMVDWCGMGWEFEKFIEFLKWVFLFWWILVDGFFGF
jgi:hypothetical protein